MVPLWYVASARAQPRPAFYRRLDLFFVRFGLLTGARSFLRVPRIPAEQREQTSPEQLHGHQATDQSTKQHLDAQARGRWIYIEGEDWH